MLPWLLAIIATFLLAYIALRTHGAIPTHATVAYTVLLNTLFLQAITRKLSFS